MRHYLRYQCVEATLWWCNRAFNASVGGLFHCGIADLWKCAICQSPPRFATTNVVRPDALIGLPSFTKVTVSSPVTTTAVSEGTMPSLYFCRHPLNLRHIVVMD
jgi:hypothetical protein